MTKQEFLDGLTASLSTNGSVKLADDNKVFYDGYISGEIAKGRTEADVMEELGDPRLIANSILQAEGFKDVFAEGTKTYTAYDTPDGDPTTFAQGREYKGKSFEEQKEYEVKQEKKKEKKQKIGSSFKAVMTVIIVILVIALIIALIILAAKGIINLFGPVLIPIIIIILLFRLFRRR